MVVQVQSTSHKTVCAHDMSHRWQIAGQVSTDDSTYMPICTSWQGLVTPPQQRDVEGRDVVTAQAPSDTSQ